MRRFHPRGGVVRPVAALALSAVLALTASSCGGGTTTPRGDPAGASGSRPVLDPVGARYVGAPIPITGYTSEVPAGKHKLALQQFSNQGHGWSTRAVAYVRSGVYRFAAQRVSSPGSARFRTVLYVGGRPVAISDVLTVELVGLPAHEPACVSSPSPATCARPESITQQRRVDVTDCPMLRVTTHAETSTVSWRWDAASAKWVQDPTAWVPVPGSEVERPAGFTDCVRIVSELPTGAALPDIRIKDLTRCGRGDAQATGGTCFMVVPSAPHDADFPSLEGRKLMKFGVVTLNAGAGPAEIIADRSAPDAAHWEAYQGFYDARGNLLGSMTDARVKFYFAGDGHDHWHVRDFDDYELLDASGTAVARAEKHGYCMQDNTSYDPMQGQPRVDPEPTYTESTTCGKGLPQALTIVHGLSRGWGDTYPTELPDQALDITGVPDGVYTVRVHADAGGAIRESDEDNNVAEVQVRIVGDTVTVRASTSKGGLP